MSDSHVSPTGATVAAELDVPELSGGGDLLAGRYEIVGLIGAGGMGRVYRARDTELDEVVALKMLHKDLCYSDGMAARFRQEVKLARRVTHKNVARTFDISEHKGEKFLTMELIDGVPLTRLLAQRGGLPIEDALAIAGQICAGMAAAHAAGIVHRDLKPDNVLVTNAGRVVITDFGIARVGEPGAVTKTSGAVVGTPAYMAPEQVLAADDIDARADVYAFGAVLFEMLTGERAWPGDSPFAVAAARLMQPPRDPRTVRTDLPAVLAGIVTKCLAREVGERFENAEMLGAALAASSSSVQSLAPVPSLPAATRNALSVAVTRFRNAGPTDDEYLADGITEDLIDALSMVQGLRVRAVRSDDALDVGRSGVDVMIEGTVRRVEQGRLRVSARLVGVADGFHIWSSRFERPLGSALALNDEVARAVATALSAKLTGPAVASADTEAVEHYLRARHELMKTWLVGNIEAAIESLAKAAARAPNDPRIVSGYVLNAMRNIQRAHGLAPEMEKLITPHLTTSPHLGEPWVAYASLRFNGYDDAPGAMRALKRAISVAPSLADAHDLAGRMLLEVDEVDEAAARLEHALWLDSTNLFTRVDLMRIAAYRDDWPHIVELAGGRENMRVQTIATVARLALWQKEPPPELDSLPIDRVPATADRGWRSMIGIWHKVGLARKIMDEDRPMIEELSGLMLASRSRARRLFTQSVAEVYAYAHEDDEAMRFVRESVGAGLLDLTWMKRNPVLAHLRSKPEFASLTEAVAVRAKSVADAWHAPL